MSNRPKPRMKPGQLNFPDLSKPDASYSGSCVICLTGTDTGLSFEGELEWLTAGLMHLGMPQPMAITMVDKFAPPVDGNDRTAATFRVCEACVNKTNFPKPALLINGGTVPCIGQMA